MAAELRYRQSSEMVKVKIPKRDSKGKVMKDKDGNVVVEKEVEMRIRDVLYDKYGMGVGMEDKMVKKKVWRTGNRGCLHAAGAALQAKLCT